MITFLVRRVGPVAGLGVMLLLALRGVTLPPATGDLWFHLRLGHEFRDGWSLSDPGHLGVYDTASWTPTQWLPQIGLSWLESTTGLAGVLWITGLVLVALLVTVYVTARLEVAPLPAALATVLCYLGLAPGMSARPQVLSFLLLAVVLAAWRATVRDGRPRYWLVLVAWLWAPLHGMWPLAIVVGVVMVAGLALDRSLDRGVLARLLLIPLGSSLVVMATPVGADVYASVFAVGSRSSYFAEWQAPDFTESLTLGVSAMVAVVLLGLLRRRSPVPWTDVLLLGLGIAAALYSQRTLPVAAVLLAPLAAQVLQGLVPGTGGLGRREGLGIAAMSAVLLAGFLLVVPDRADVRPSPAWLDAALADRPAGTRVLNEWDIGPYYLWRHPHLDLAMHGYGEVFTDAELERNIDILRTQPGWEDQVRELDADLALVQVGGEMEYGLAEQLGWRVLDSDDDVALLESPTG